MNIATKEKSTNVRFMAWFAAATALAGCTASPPRIAQRAACDLGTQAVCTTFGPARSCECVPRTEIDRYLRTFGEPAGLGATR
jgi:hypothetical protein